MAIILSILIAVFLCFQQLVHKLLILNLVKIKRFLNLIVEITSIRYTLAVHIICFLCARLQNL